MSHPLEPPAPDRPTIARYQENLQKEIDGAALYEAMAEIETQPQLAEVYRRLAASELRHADFWERQLRATGQPTPPRRVGWRTRALVRLTRWFGPRFVLPTLIQAEQVDSWGYDGQTDACSAGLPAQERSHLRLLQAIGGTEPGGMQGGILARLEGRHRPTGGNALRAAVLGANDGLVSNFSLIMGVAGADPSGRVILVAGLAGLLAGASSMALGEWISVQSSRELYEREIAVEKSELDLVPEEEAEELALIYQSKGLPEAEARSLATRIISDQATALDTLAREELGIDPAELGGSPWVAAGVSFVLFAGGAVVPVLPFLFLTGGAAVAASLIASAAALFLVGAGITLLTGRSVAYSGARQVLFGLAAAGLTFAIGRLIGISLAG